MPGRVRQSHGKSEEREEDLLLGTSASLRVGFDLKRDHQEVRPSAALDASAVMLRLAMLAIDAGKDRDHLYRQDREHAWPPRQRCVLVSSGM